MYPSFSYLNRLRCAEGLSALRRRAFFHCPWRCSLRALAMMRSAQFPHSRSPVPDPSSPEVPESRHLFGHPLTRRSCQHFRQWRKTGVSRHGAAGCFVRPAVPCSARLAPGSRSVLATAGCWGAPACVGTGYHSKRHVGTQTPPGHWLRVQRSASRITSRASKFPLPHRRPGSGPSWCSPPKFNETASARAMRWRPGRGGRSSHGADGLLALTHRRFRRKRQALWPLCVVPLAGVSQDQTDQV